MLEKETSRYWKTILETMADGLMVVDSDGVIVSVNSAMEKLTGYSRTELVGQSCEILGCDVCTRERSEGLDKHCALFKEERIRRARCTLRKKDGTPLYAIKNASVLKDSRGDVIGGVETLNDLSEVMNKEKLISNLRRELNSKNSFHGIIAASPAMHRLSDLISSAARSDAPVVIYGESGTGKELVAEAVHRLGPRQKGPFIKVNCAALNESLLESELFGHVKGAFTGAGHTRIGRFEAANRGDIFLDEIGDLPASVQVKLLRVLQEKEIERVGDHRPVPADVRIISATHKDLMKLVEEGQFREDLYYRIGVIPVHIPPLRARREDIPLLVNSFINRLRLKTEKNIFGMTQTAYELLNTYHWPGNVRELMNVIEYAFVLCPGGDILPGHLPPSLTASEQYAKDRLQVRKHPEKQEENRESFSAFSDKTKDDAEEVRRIRDALVSAGGNKARAARMLGISRVSLYKRLRDYDIQTGKTVFGP